MIFRFTLSNALAGSIVINEPDGWKDTAINLQRQTDFHSLIEVVDSTFFFYNKNNFIDGGRQFIYAIEQQQGINAVISITIDISENAGASYITCFTGNLDLSTLKDSSKGDKFYKFSCGIIPSNTWSKFINRRSTTIDLNSLTTIDGVATAAAPNIVLQLPSQVINSNYKSTESNGVSTGQAQGTSYYVPLSLDNAIVNEFNVGSPEFAFVTDPTLIDGLFIAANSGYYTFDIKISLTVIIVNAGLHTASYTSPGTLHVTGRNIGR